VNCERSLVWVNPLIFTTAAVGREQCFNFSSNGVCSVYLQFQNTNNKSNCISSTERLAWMERYAQRDTSNHCLVLPRSHPRLSLLPSTLCVSLSLVRARALSLHTVSRQSLFSLSFYIFLMCTHQSEDGAVSWRSNTSSRSNATNVSGPMEVSTGACVKERERERLCSY